MNRRQPPKFPESRQLTKHKLFRRKYAELKVAEFEGGRPAHHALREMAWTWARRATKQLRTVTA